MSEEDLCEEIRRYRVQLTEGCHDSSCTNPFCATARGDGVPDGAASALAMQLVRQRAPMCLTQPPDGPALIRKDVEGTTTFLHRMLLTSPFARLFADDGSGRDTQPYASHWFSRAMSGNHTADHRNVDTTTIPPSVDQMEAMVNASQVGEIDPLALTGIIHGVFSSPHTLLSGFAPGAQPHDTQGTQSVGTATSPVSIDIGRIRGTCARMMGERLKAERLHLTLGTALTQLLHRLQDFRDVRALSHLFVIAIELHALLEQQSGVRSAARLNLRLLGRVAVRLQRAGDAGVVTFFATRDLDFTKVVVSSIQLELQHVVGGGFRQGDSVPLFAALLAILYRANQIRQRAQLPALLDGSFSNSLLLNQADLKNEYQVWKREGFGSGHSLSDRPETFTILQYPCLLDPNGKARVLRIDAVLQMSQMIQDAVVHQAWVAQTRRLTSSRNDDADSAVPMAVRDATNPYLVLEIRRGYLIEDTLRQITLQLKGLKKPLKIKYVGSGEEGLDLGGVQKEFFQLIMSQIFDPMRGLFVEQDGGDGVVWINGESVEGLQEFELVGVLLGLAVYNSVQLDLRFPAALYRKLLGADLGLCDLAGWMPEVAHGLAALIKYEDADAVSDVFGLTFQIDRLRLGGKVETVELIPNGAEIAVTGENRQEFVRLYTEFILTTSIAPQFEALSRGLHAVCGGPALRLFTPVELELVICGSPQFDFNDLQSVATYDGGYSKESPCIEWLWDLVHSWDLPQQKQFLHYVTGSDRVPIMGLKTMTLVVQRNGSDSDRLPTALTCFGRLLLPEYGSKSKLSERLLLALEHGAGFGLA
eukprot:m.307874 g.307874  ORF g.307874 m.307874 type:complete len:815 (-) comp27396_c0_seq1:2679-5123(-)